MDLIKEEVEKIDSVSALELKARLEAALNFTSEDLVAIKNFLDCRQFASEDSLRTLSVEQKAALAILGAWDQFLYTVTESPLRFLFGSIIEESTRHMTMLVKYIEPNSADKDHRKCFATDILSGWYSLHSFSSSQNLGKTVDEVTALLVADASATEESVDTITQDSIEISE